MATQWFYKIMGEIVGPLSSGELREKALAGEISPDTLVRQGESGDWVLADHVRGLFSDPHRPPPRPEKGGQDDRLEDAAAEVLGLPVRPPQQAPQASNLRDCPDCGRAVSRTASQCPQCGHAFRERKDTDAQTPPAAGTAWTGRKLALIIVCLCALTGVGVYTIVKVTSLPAGGSREEVYKLVTEHVESELRASHDAAVARLRRGYPAYTERAWQPLKFSAIDDEATTVDYLDGKWQITGWVDDYNPRGDGVAIRIEYEATAQWLPDSEKWRIEAKPTP